MRKYIDIIKEANDATALKKQIISRVQDETDKQLLDRVLQVLEKANLDDKIQSEMGKDPDSKKHISAFSQIIMSTDGTIEEKTEFLDKYPKGFIKTNALMQENTPIKFDDFLTDQGFAKRVFLNTISYAPMGIGPGELALALMSPKIRSIGGGSEAGDLLIDGKNVELKTKRVEAGRLNPGRKAQYDFSSIKKTLEKHGITVGDRLTAKYWVTTLRSTLKPVAVKDIANSVVDNLFKFTNKKAALKQALASGSMEDIKREFGLLSYDNYRNISKFSHMMLMDVASQMVITFSDIDVVKDLIKTEAPNLYGPEQEAMPKVTFRIPGAAATEPVEPAVAAAPEPTNIQPEVLPTPGARAKIAPVGKAAGRATRGAAGIGRAKR